MRRRFALLLVGALVFVGCTPAKPAHMDIILSTTTSTQDSGLLDLLIPQFEKESGYKVKVIAVGTGQALEMGRRGQADALLTHASASEKPLVDEGFVINYQRVMHNDFVLVGPPADPAGIKGMKAAADALQQIAGKRATFVSRGDDSGTHKKEKELWGKASVTPADGWYLESGTGMGQTLMIASEKNGYTLTDRGTYLAQRQNLALAILVEGDASLLNIYHVMQVNPAKFSKVNGPGAEAFVTFMLKPETQKTISTFGAQEYGQPLFFANTQ